MGCDTGFCRNPLLKPHSLAPEMAMAIADMEMQCTEPVILGAQCLRG